MKYFLLIGGFCGFLAAFASGLAVGNELSYTLCNATIGCICGALVMRGFRALLTHQLRQVAVQQSATEAPVATQQ